MEAPATVPAVTLAPWQKKIEELYILVQGPCAAKAAALPVAAAHGP